MGYTSTKATTVLLQLFCADVARSCLKHWLIAPNSFCCSSLLRCPFCCAPSPSSSTELVKALWNVLIDFYLQQFSAATLLLSEHRSHSLQLQSLTLETIVVGCLSASGCTQYWFCGAATCQKKPTSTFQILKYDWFAFILNKFCFLWYFYPFYSAVPSNLAPTGPNLNIIWSQNQVSPTAACQNHV